MSDKIQLSAASFTIRPVGSFDEFVDHSRALLDKAPGSDIVLLPELFTLELFTVQEGWENEPVSALPRVAEYTQDYLDLFAEEARQRNQFIAAGSHLEKRGDEYLNIAHLFGPDGEHFEHAKTHIFPAEADWKTSEGTKMEVFDLPFAKIGFNICYEAEIPECSAALTEQGAEIILCPSFTFTEAGHWRVRHGAASRAIENQVFVMHSSTGGTARGPLPSGWTQNSVLSPADAPWDPRGIVAQAPTANSEDVTTGIVNLKALHHNREVGAATTYKDRRRRADLYRSWPSHLNN